MWRSTDGGKTFENASAGLVSEDIHDVAVVRNGSRLIYATTNMGLHVSNDDGRSWEVKPLELALAVHARDHAARRRLGLRAALQWRRPARLVGQADAQPRPWRALGRCRPAGQARKLGLVRRHQSGRSETDLRRDRARPVFPLAGRRRELDRAAAPPHRDARARVGAGLRGATMDHVRHADALPGSARPRRTRTPSSIMSSTSEEAFTRDGPRADNEYRDLGLAAASGGRSAPSTSAPSARSSSRPAGTGTT